MTKITKYGIIDYGNEEQIHNFCFRGSCFGEMHDPLFLYRIISRKTYNKINFTYEGEININHVINDAIKCKDVMLILENGEKQVISLNDALDMAYEAGLDLVQLNNSTERAVCKILDYKKFLYEQKKKEHQNASKNKQELKEVRLNDGTADNDLKVKANTISRILREGDKVKVTVVYKGRMIRLAGERGVIKLNTLEPLVTEPHNIDSAPKLEGNRVYMILSPKSVA